MTSEKKLRISVRIITVIMLVIAIPEGLPYGYYTLLRWVVTASSIILLLHAYSSEKIPWTVILGIQALLFNPIIPIYLEKEVWVIIDAIAAAIILISFLIERASYPYRQD